MYRLIVLTILLANPVNVNASWPDDATALAGICFHELTWQVEAGDCEAIRDVIASLAVQRNWTFRGALRRLCRRYSNGISNRPFARLLRRGSYVNPIGWPESWPNLRHYRGNLDRLFEVAGRATDIPLEIKSSSCRYMPHRWGSRNPRLPDIHRARRMISSGRWVDAECGETVQGYYAVSVRIR